MENVQRLVVLVARLTVASFVLLVGYLGLRFLLGGDIIVDVSMLDHASKTVVYVDDEQQLAYNERTKSFAIKDAFGGKRVVVRAPGYEEYSTELRVFLRGEKRVTAQLTPITAEEVARSLDSGFGADSYNTAAAKYFGTSSEWLAFRAISRADPSESHSLIAFFTAAGEWRVLNYGGEEHEFDIANPNPTIPLPPAELYEEYFQ
jgi:hypothetical protein